MEFFVDDLIYLYEIMRIFVADSQKESKNRQLKHCFRSCKIRYRFQVTEKDMGVSASVTMSVEGI